MHGPPEAKLGVQLGINQYSNVYIISDETGEEREARLQHIACDRLA